MASVLVSKRDSVYTLTLNRPERLNALDLPTIAEFRKICEELHAKSPRAVIVTGAGRGFCAGADLIAIPAEGTSIGERIASQMASHFNPAVLAFRGLPCPTIAAVNGVAAGGGASLALLADICVASRSATFVQVFGPRLGLVPDLGATWTLPRLVGRARATALALLGDKLDASTAVEWGLIWKAVPDDTLMAEVNAIADRLAAGPTAAFREITMALEVSLDNTLEQQLELERNAQQRRGNDPNFVEGVAAFKAKREPKFS